MASRLAPGLPLAVLIGACAHHANVGSGVAPSDSSFSAVDRAFDAQPHIGLTVDSASARLVLTGSGMSAGPLGGKVKAEFPVGRMLASSLERFGNRVFRENAAAPLNVNVGITDWTVKYGAHHGLVGGASLDSVSMDAVLTVEYSPESGRSSTRTYSYHSQAQRAPAGERTDNASLVAEAVDSVVVQLLNAIVSRTSLMRRRQE
jgi:hypothetical protein